MIYWRRRRGSRYNCCWGLSTIDWTSILLCRLVVDTTDHMDDLIAVNAFMCGTQFKVRELALLYTAWSTLPVDSWHSFKEMK